MAKKTMESMADSLKESLRAKQSSSGVLTEIRPEDVGKPEMNFIHPVGSGSESESDPNKEWLNDKPEKPESKSKRVQLLVKPSFYQRAKAEADAHGLSFNEFIVRTVEHYLNEEK